MTGCIVGVGAMTLCGRQREPSEFVFEDRRHAMLYHVPAHPLRLSVCPRCFEKAQAIDKATP